MKSKTVGVIDVASNELRLKIAQVSESGLKVIDSARKPLNLGRDTFRNGKISFESVEKAAVIIIGFKQILKEYNVKEVRAIATTAIREAENRDYVLDQIYCKTGIKLEIIDDNEEKLYINRIVLENISEQYMTSSLVVHIGSGSISIITVENSIVTNNQTMRIGALRVSELFEDYAHDTDKYFMVIREYLKSFVESVDFTFKKNLSNIIISGNEVDLIGKLCGANETKNVMTIIKEDFALLYKNVRDKTPEYIAEKYNISFEKAEIFLTAIITCNRLFKYTKATKILSPSLTLSDAIIYEMCFYKGRNDFLKFYDESAVYFARETARRFSTNDYPTNDIVENFAVLLFNKLKKIHNLNPRDCLLLRIAAIMRNTGTFINTKLHYIHSYNIIKGSDIPGIMERDKLIAANVAKFHSSITPSLSDSDYAELTPEERNRVSKLTAILRIADSLDRSHSGKFTNIDVRIYNNVLTITAETIKNIELEMWAFRAKSKFFEEVFGIKAVLKQRRQFQ